MPAVSAFLVPGSPLPLLRGDEPPYRPLREALDGLARRLADSRPDVLLVYSSRWIAVLDALWQTRPRLQGVHVDEVWHDLGDLPYDLHVDSELATACVAATNEMGLRAKGVDFDAFPVDTGTVVANALLNAGERPVPQVITANNIYHDGPTIERLGALALSLAERQGKRAAVLAIGGLSSQFYRTEIDLSEDRIAEPTHDELNRRLLDLLAGGDADAIRAFLPDFSERARGDHHMKHLWWLLGATGGIQGATLHAYGPDYGSGMAVMEFALVSAAAAQAEGPAPGAVAPVDTATRGATRESPVWQSAMRPGRRRAAARSWSRPGP
jgi:2-aminophenol/2-amino-5-chlorophenol 1,6-dioxygenase subunit alpha